MGLAHGQTPPFDISTVNFEEKIKLRYGPSISGVGIPTWINPYNLHNFKRGLRRYIFQYNSNTKTYDHIETYKTCRKLTDLPLSVVDTEQLKCLFSLHGSLISEAPPSGLNEEIKKIFINPLHGGQKVFIDCVTNVLAPTYIGNAYTTIEKQYTTEINRYGVIKNNDVLYFKNCTLSSYFVKSTDNMGCNLPSGACYFSYIGGVPTYCRTTTEYTCNIIRNEHPDATWYQNSGCQTGACIIDNGDCFTTNYYLCSIGGGNGGGNWYLGSGCN